MQWDVMTHAVGDVIFPLAMWIDLVGNLEDIE
jgi:hypothetical protein